MKVRLAAVVAMVLALAGTVQAQDHGVPCTSCSGAISADGGPCGGCACESSWTGFYVGFSVGGARNDSSYTLRPAGEFVTNPIFIDTNGLPTDAADLDKTKFLFGGQVGYDLQLSSFVVGVCADFTWLDLGESDSVNRALVAPLAGNFVHTVTQDLDWFSTIRGRVGFASGDFLFYGTGGLAFGKVESTSDTLFTLGGDHYVGSRSDTEFGWVIGVGVEYKISCNVSLKAEYLYIDLGDASYGSPEVTASPTFSYATDIETQFHVINLGLNFRFGG
jgi:outer membrane immunogenic protein